MIPCTAIEAVAGCPRQNDGSLRMFLWPFLVPRGPTFFLVFQFESLCFFIRDRSEIQVFVVFFWVGIAGIPYCLLFLRPSSLHFLNPYSCLIVSKSLSYHMLSLITDTTRYSVAESSSKSVAIRRATGRCRGAPFRPFLLIKFNIFANMKYAFLFFCVFLD